MDNVDLIGKIIDVSSELEKTSVLQRDIPGGIRQHLELDLLKCLAVTARFFRRSRDPEVERNALQILMKMESKQVDNDDPFRSALRAFCIFSHSEGSTRLRSGRQFLKAYDHSLDLLSNGLDRWLLKELRIRVDRSNLA